MFYENGKAVNQAARTAAKFLAEKGIKLPHSQALELIARLQGFPSHAAASARLEGTRTGAPQTLKNWADLFQVIACMNETERLGSVTFSEGVDAQGEAQFFDAELIVKATHPSIAKASSDILETTDYVLLCAGQGHATGESQETQRTAHRIAMQAELVTGESGIYREVYAAMRRNPLACIQEFNRKWDVSLMDGPWVVWSDAEEGYWHHNFGWVGDRDSAVGFPDEVDAEEAARFAGEGAKARHCP